MLTMQFHRSKTQSPGVNKYFFHSKIDFTYNSEIFALYYNYFAEIRGRNVAKMISFYPKIGLKMQSLA